MGTRRVRKSLCPRSTREGCAREISLCQKIVATMEGNPKHAKRQSNAEGKKVTAELLSKTKKPSDDWRRPYPYPSNSLGGGEKVRVLRRHPVMKQRFVEITFLESSCTRDTS